MPFNHQKQIKLPGLTEPVELSRIVAITQTCTGRIEKLFTLDGIGWHCSGNACSFEPHVDERFRVNTGLGKVHVSLGDRTGFVEDGKGNYLNPDNIIAGYIDGEGTERLLMRGGLEAVNIPTLAANDNDHYELRMLMPFAAVKRKGTFDIMGNLFTGTFYINPRYWNAKENAVVVMSDIEHAKAEPVPVYARFKSAELHMRSVGPFLF